MKILRCFTADFHVTCGARYVSRNEVQVSCAELDEEGPEITAISYTLNSGSPRTGVCSELYMRAG